MTSLRDHYSTVRTYKSIFYIIDLVIPEVFYLGICVFYEH